jgi:hypothetical protein
MRKASPFILITSILVAPVSTAFAHAYLQSAVPPVDSTVIVTPSEVAIAFTGAIEPRFSTIEVTGPDAQRVDDARPRMTPGDTTHLTVGVRELVPGTYNVAWHATSVDTHQTDGQYRFTVAATNAPAVVLDHVWARATIGMSTTGAVYFTVTNAGPPDRLVGVSTPVAVTAELHESINDNGVMKMRPVPSVVLDPGKPVTFKPGGYHVMLTGLKDPLKVGDSFPLTLTFEHAQPMTVMAKVEPAGGAAMQMPQGDTGRGSMPGMKGN